MEKVLKKFKRKNTESYYISLYAKYYIEHKSKMTEKSTGKVIEELILSSNDFKKVMNDFFESSKL